MAAHQLAATVDHTLGWLGEFDSRFDRVNGRYSFFPDEGTRLDQRLGLTERSTIYAVLDDFHRMVRSYGARLAIAFAPSPARLTVHGDPNLGIAEQQLARFQRDHPDVKFLFPLVTRFGVEKFGMWNHISREYTFLSSERFGRALARLLSVPDSIPPFEPGYRDPPPYQKIEAKPLGAPDPQLREAAMALYLYANTADDKYRQLMSRQVLDRLEQEPAFRYMMDDARERVASLHRRGIDIGFDLSQLQVTPVAVQGTTSCNNNEATVWVQIAGSLVTTYKSPQASLTAPIPWPVESRIFIPLVREDGIAKFDGYCPEPSVAPARIGS